MYKTANFEIWVQFPFRFFRVCEHTNRNRHYIGVITAMLIASMSATVPLIASMINQQLCVVGCGKFVITAFSISVTYEIIVTRPLEEAMTWFQSFIR